MALMITPWATGALAGRNGEWYVPMNSAAAAPPGTALVCREPAVYCIAGERHGTAEPVTPVSVTDCHCVTQHLITAFDI